MALLRLLTMMVSC